MKIINTCYAIYGNKTIFSLIFYCFFSGFSYFPNTVMVLLFLYPCAK